MCVELGVRSVRELVDKKYIYNLEIAKVRSKSFARGVHKKNLAVTCSTDSTSPTTFV